MLSAQLRAPATDATGLRGEYQFTLSWTRDLDGGSGLPVPSASADSRDSRSPLPALSDSEPAPTLFGALESQLGLKLLQKKGPIEMLVIDHIEKIPTGN
jgi:uncharacterized protein (TIGR03435 family)